MKGDDRSAVLEFFLLRLDRFGGGGNDLGRLVHAAAFLALLLLEDEAVFRARLGRDIRFDRWLIEAKMFISIKSPISWNGLTPIAVARSLTVNGGLR
jgi:hypothetical protein